MLYINFMWHSAKTPKLPLEADMEFWRNANRTVLSKINLLLAILFVLPFEPIITEIDKICSILFVNVCDCFMEGIFSKL